jgi:signal transduction histidine kinase
VAVRQTDGHLDVHIRDDGRGFGGAEFEYQDEELAALGIGPVSLRERIGELGGSLRVSSSAAGAELRIRVPFR